MSVGLVEGTPSDLVTITEEEGGWRLSYSGPPVMSIGLRVDLAGERWLRMGYQSWGDGSSFEPWPEQRASIPGHVVFQALGAEVTQIGFTDVHHHQVRFWPGVDDGGPHVDVEILTDRVDRPIEVHLSRTTGTSSYDLLSAWAHDVAAATGARTDVGPVTGWCSWYHLYTQISDAQIREHLAAAKQYGGDLRVFQIDDGYTTEIGDWLDVRPTFPDGLAPLLHDIDAEGYMPGLWIAPFMAGNRSKLATEHPDWLVTDRETGKPRVIMTFYGENRWSKRSEEYHIVDTTHPEAMAYLRRVFRTWRSWGMRYVKTDFMYHGMDLGPDEVVRYDQSRTRAEIFTEALTMIREEIGEETIWIGCGCPLFVASGFVDGIRIGIDVGANWVAIGRTDDRNLRDAEIRSVGNGVLWRVDPDCLLLRDRFHTLSDDEVRTLAYSTGMLGGITLTSDNFAELSDERRALWESVLALATTGTCTYPLSGNPAYDDVVVQVRHADGKALVHVANVTREELSLSIPADLLGLTGDDLEFALPPHGSDLRGVEG